MNLEAHPLQIKSQSDEGITHLCLDSKCCSCDFVIDIFYHFGNSLRLQLRFWHCSTSSYDRQVELGSTSKERIKIWTITTRKNNITVNLNGIRVLNAEYINNCSSSEYDITHAHFYEKFRNSSEYRILEAGMHYIG